ncbi:MAG: hypothetical protein OQJ96_04170 [Flavobacteriales bacterium]|nr:hypothetical protein [Flavobacteriales bacterium]MCW8912033.1 hypothetical protein [Flavobacteriales bacterium]MCW8936673.1 hypothetical protein [Flavobacteriales bacterium]MCW8939572.1 hypothetical protein [Flavobacteriales bacterium]MCW8968471.1 hypothetical protein [Flavobacteriales bacterium]
MKRIIIYISVLASVFISCSNSKYIKFLEKYNKGKEQYNNKHFCESKKTLLSLYESNENQFPDGYFTLAKALYLCGDKKESYRYFELGIKKQGVPIKFYKKLEVDSLFSNQLIQDSFFQKIITDSTNLYVEYENSLNVELKNAIDSLFVIDQKVRNNRENYTNFEEFTLELGKIDSSNLYAIKKLINEHEFPNQLNIGRSSSDFMTMMFHTLSFDDNYKEWKYYFNKIKKNMLRSGGYGGGHYYMFFVDESYLNSKKYKEHQLYGTWFDYKTNEIYPIIDIKDVDKRRNKMGQKSLYEYAKQMNLILPKNYVYKNNSDD